MKCLLVLVGLTSLAIADVKVDALEAAYSATAKTAGAARVTQACTDAPAIEKAANALPTKVPHGSGLYDETWQGLRDSVLSDLTTLVTVCATPDKKRKLLSGAVETADQIVARIDADVHAAIEGGRPRTLPSDLQKLGVAIGKVKPTKAACAQRKTLSKASGLATPAQIDANKWLLGVTGMAAALDDLDKAACVAHPNDVEISGSLEQVRLAYMQLVLAIPPSK